MYIICNIITLLFELTNLFFFSSCSLIIGIWKGREYPYNPTPDWCLPIHFFDRCQMIGHVIFIVLKYGAFVYLYVTSGNTYNLNGSLIAMDDLEEFHAKQISQTFERETVPSSTTEGTGGISSISGNDDESKEEINVEKSETSNVKVSEGDIELIVKSQ